MDNKITREMMKEASKAATPEELKKMAAKRQITMSDKEAGLYYARLHRSGELSDEEIDNVAGGGCNDPNDPKGTCADWESDGNGAYDGCCNCKNWMINGFSGWGMIEMQQLPTCLKNHEGGY